MGNRISDFVEQLRHRNASVTDGDLAMLVGRYPIVQFPSGYMEFLRLADGAEGMMGENYLMIYPAREAIAKTISYKADEFAPGLILFGSNGGGEAFGFDARKSPPMIVMIPWTAMNWEDAIPQGHSFKEFLERIATNRLFDRNQIDPKPRPAG